MGQGASGAAKGLALAAAAALASGLYALKLGKDVNADLRNYHFESAHEFLAGRMDVDAAPAGLVHSYFNPLPYVPFYEMARNWPPRLEIFAIGAWQGLAFALALALAFRLAPGRGFPRLVVGALAGLTSLAAPMALSEVGSTFADLSLAPFVLAGALAIVSADETRGWLAPLGAFLVGLAVGLKLTNAIYVFGVAASVGLGWNGWRRSVTALVASAAAGALGVALSGGFWCWTLWTRFRSPVFPYFDSLFVSPELDPASPIHGRSLYDPHFVFTSVGDALALPFRWVALNQTTSEEPFRDIRFAALAVALVLGLAFRIARRSGGGDPAGDRLLAFFLASFAAWAYAFPIQRYLMALELMIGPCLLAALSAALAGRVLNVALGAIAFASVAMVRAPHWDHAKPSGDWFEMRVPVPLQSPALVFTEPYTSYLAPFLPAESVVVGLGPATNLRAGSGIFLDRVARAALARDLPVFLLVSGLVRPQNRISLGGYGLRFSEACLPISNAAGFLAACPLARGPVSPKAARELRPDETLTFGASAESVPALLDAWNADTSWGQVGDGYQPKLIVEPDAAFAGAPIKLTFRVQGLGEFGANEALTLSADGAEIAAWPKPEDKATLVACAPADLLRPGVATTLAFGGPQKVRGSMGLLSLTAGRGGCEAKP